MKWWDVLDSPELKTRTSLLNNQPMVLLVDTLLKESIIKAYQKGILMKEIQKMIVILHK
jgi:hypothetical protein